MPCSIRISFCLSWQQLFVSKELKWESTTMIQGDPKEVNIVILLWPTEKRLNRAILFYLIVHIGRFNYLSFFYFMSKNWPLNKLPFFLEINGKWLFIQGIKKINCLTSSVFSPFLKDPADKQRPHSQISFKVGKIMLFWIVFLSFKIIAMVAWNGWFPDWLSFS